MTLLSRPVPALLRAGAFALALAPGLAHAQDESAAEPDTDAPALGEPYLAATHRDWQVLCTRLEAEGPEICEMYQLLSETNGQPVAEISIAALGEDGDITAGATITTPLETFLPTGLGFRTSADADAMRIEEFRVCTVIGCVVRMGLSAEEVATLQSGTEAFLTIAPFVAVDQPVDIRISLLGFTAALADVRERTPNAPTMNAPEPEAPLAAPTPVDPSTPPATPPAAQD